MSDSQASADGKQARPSAQAPATAPVRALASEQLLQGAKSVEISHNGAVYRLQATRLGKLILTK
jgi:hemin uptake protein HemP